MKQYAVVDLEMCNVSDQKRKEFKIAKEIIQIGAVLLDENFNEIDKFVTFVKPDYGAIDGYIHGLTGISNGDLVGAPNLKHALEAFIKWLPKESVLVSWSNNDKLQIYFETERKGLEIDGIFKLSDDWLDCQKEFSDKLKTKKVYRLSEALSISNIIYDEGAHNGLVDAINTAKLFKKLMTEEKFTLSPYYVSQEEETYSFGFSLGSLLRGSLG